MSLSRSKAGAALVAGLGLIAAFLFFAGWVYVVSYFAAFGLSLNALKLPAYAFLTYSFVVCSDFRAALLIVAGILYFLLTSRLTYDRQLLVSDAILLVVAFAGVYLVALSRGHADAEKRMGPADTSLPAVSICLTEPDRAPPSVDMQNLRLLTYTDNDAYVFEPLGAASRDRTVRLFVFPRSSVRFMSIRPRK